MFGLRFVSLAVAAILCGTASATPIPHNPAPGEIVHIAPSQTTGGSVGTGADAPHPHINLGHLGNGHYALAPVTHGTADHLRPYMATPQNQHHLGGVTRLDHVVGHASQITRSGGRLRGAQMSPNAVHDINQAKNLVQAHRDAGNAHAWAGQAHRGEQAHHEDQASHHYQTGNFAAGQHHTTQAGIHAGHAEKHEQAAANHHHAANMVTGPDATAHAHAQNSAAHAHGVYQSINAAHQHANNAHAFAQQGNHPAAQAEHGHSVAAHAAAIHSSTTSITHHNSATGHHL